MIRVKEAPSLIEIDPCEYRRVVVVPLNLGPQAVLPVFPGLMDRLAPEVRSVSHDEETKFVSPIEFARHLNFYVNTVTIEAQLLGNQDLILHELITGECVITFRMIALVKAKLEIDRLIVESHIFEIRPREVHHTDFPLAEI